jgi:hypothetical protein
MSEVNVGHGRSKEELKHELAVALNRHEVTLSDSMLDLTAEIAWAGTGPRLLVLPRLGILGGRLAVRGYRWLRQHRVDPDDDEDGEKGAT